MKRRQLIEWGIITIGLIFGYKFFEGLFSAFVQIIWSFGFQSGDDAVAILPMLVMIAIYAICFILFIRNSKNIATYIDRPNTGNDNELMIRIGKRSLLQVILVGICIAAIITKAGDVLIYLFETFRSEAGGKDPFDESLPSVNSYRFKVATVQVILGIITIYFSKEISSWFIHRNDADELIFDSESEKK